MSSVMVALITPFTKDYKVDYKALDALVSRLLKEDVDGFIVCGTTAETPTLSKHERYTILRHVIKKTKKRAEIWFGCGTNSTQSAIEACKEAEKEDITGVLLVTPYYNRPSQEGMYQHFHAIASSIHCPIMLYNIPSRTGVNLSYETIAALLCEHSNITALKHASHDLDDMCKLKQQYPAFCIYSGEDSFFDEGLDIGMDGLVSVMGHVFLPQMKAYIQDGRRNLILLKQLYEAAKYTFIEPSPAPIKYMLYQRGECENVLRLPLVALSETGMDKFHKWLSKSDK